MDVKINADLNGAIEKIAAVLGTTAKDIIPRYTRLALAQGIIWSIAGIIFLVFPWVVLPQPLEGEQSFFIWLARVVLSIIGFSITMDHLENIFAPDAVAIDKLISSITPSNGEY